jgi:hypothetical protein
MKVSGSGGLTQHTIRFLILNPISHILYPTYTVGTSAVAAGPICLSIMR